MHRLESVPSLRTGMSSHSPTGKGDVSESLQEVFFWGEGEGMMKFLPYALLETVAFLGLVPQTEKQTPLLHFPKASAQGMGNRFPGRHGKTRHRAVTGGLGEPGS